MNQIKYFERKSKCYQENKIRIDQLLPDPIDWVKKIKNILFIFKRYLKEDYIIYFKFILIMMFSNK